MINDGSVSVLLNFTSSKCGIIKNIIIRIIISIVVILVISACSEEEEETTTAAEYFGCKGSSSGSGPTIGGVTLEEATYKSGTKSFAFVNSKVLIMFTLGKQHLYATQLM